MDGFSDEILVEASRLGDRDAYALLVKRHYRYVFAVCLGMLGNIEDAEDAAQEVMLRGFAKIGQLRRGQRFDQWILRVARNLCLDLLRRKKQARTQMAPQPVTSAPSDRQNAGLADAIGRLPREIRVPLVMYYFDNKDIKTIAEKLSISYRSVCRRIRAARKQLHALLTERDQNA